MNAVLTLTGGNPAGESKGGEPNKCIGGAWWRSRLLGGGHAGGVVLEVPGVVNMELIHRSFPRKGGVAVIWTHGAKTSRKKTCSNHVWLEGVEKKKEKRRGKKLNPMLDHTKKHQNLNFFACKRNHRKKNYNEDGSHLASKSGMTEISTWKWIAMSPPACHTERAPVVERFRWLACGTQRKKISNQAFIPLQWELGESLQRSRRLHRNLMLPRTQNRPSKMKCNQAGHDKCFEGLNGQNGANADSGVGIKPLCFSQ